MGLSLAKKIFYVLVAVVFYSCAKIGSPVGGPKDEQPPIILESDPGNYSVNFEGDRIEITFNEYVTIKSLEKELFVSPPLEKRPIQKTRNKTFFLDINNDLLDSTTYTFNFGNSITDLNEGNVLPGYEFVFSTGNNLDSLSASGNIVNSFDLTPYKDPVYVMLYRNLNDSAPLIEIPYYVGRTDKEGNYRINNIKAGKYKVFALKDENNNYKYDLPKESIAFIDSAVFIDPEIMGLSKDILIDTTYLKEYMGQILKDSVIPEFVVDTITGDTIIIPKKASYTLHADMFMFDEEPKAQFLNTKERVGKEKFLFIFSRPLYDSLVLTPINFDYYDGLFLKETSLKNDTVVYWITDNTVLNMDTLKIELGYTVLDSLKNLTRRTDTISMRYRSPQQAQQRRRDRGEEQQDTVKIEHLKVSLNIQNQGKIHLKSNIIVETEKPVFEVNKDLVNLFSIIDSVETKENITLLPDTSGSLRKFTFKTDWKEAAPYRIQIDPGAFTDIYGNTNDTIELNFSAQELEYYGTLAFNITGINKNTIIQLVDNKENVVTQKSIDKDSNLKFELLTPGVYRIKLIFDSNNNGKWDTGNYMMKIQPEEVRYYGGTVDVRSNWDVEVSWNLSNNF